ncbi:MAG: hypothetical protein KBT06_00650 [Prevotellaceae bacterium]|nr:hypothetical protein [Candidatus Colivivens equi]
MTKNEQRKALLNILYVKEAVDDADVDNINSDYLDACISNTLIRFAGIDMNAELKDKVIETLSGIRALSTVITHKDLRSAILGLVGDIERYTE